MWHYYFPTPCNNLPTFLWMFYTHIPCSFCQDVLPCEHVPPPSPNMQPILVCSQNDWAKPSLIMLLSISTSQSAIKMFSSSVSQYAHFSRARGSCCSDEDAKWCWNDLLLPMLSFAWRTFIRIEDLPTLLKIEGSCRAKARWVIPKHPAYSCKSIVFSHWIRRYDVRK